MKETIFNDLIKSIGQAGRIKKAQMKPSREFHFSPVDIKAIRRKLHVSQSQFAGLIGVSVDTLQNWEQGRREPDGPARALLRVADKKPKAVLEALHR